MAGRTVVLIPSNGVNIIQSGQVFPGTEQNTQHESQQLGISPNAPQQTPQTSALEKLLNVETKTLGAIQIMIGLIHIGFGAILCLFFSRNYIPITRIGGYPFWEGLFFIVSGSLSVASMKNLNRCLVKGSVGMNITSAIMASIGIILYIAELAVNSKIDKNDTGNHSNSGYGYNYDYNYNYNRYYDEWKKSVGIGLSALLLLFSLLEFCITVSAAHFGCQATCCNSEPESMGFVPYQIHGNMGNSAGSNLSSPDYNSVGSASRAE